MDDDLSSSTMRSTRFPLAASLLLMPLANAANDAAPTQFNLWWLPVLLLLVLWLQSVSHAFAAFDTWRYRDDTGEQNEPRLAHFTDHQPTYVAALLVLVYAVFVLIAIVTIGGALQLLSEAARWIPLTLGGLIAALLLLVFGELLPRGLVTRYAREIVKYSLPALRPIVSVFAPIATLATAFSAFALKLFRVDANERTFVTETELRYLLKSAEETGVLEGEEQDMIQGVIDLDETTVREIMTPRVDVSALHINATYRDVIHVQRSDGYSRIPVYDESIDNIIGIVYARDLLDLFEIGIDLDQPMTPLITPVELVPESLSVRSMLNQMRQKKNHFAVVIDEFGGTAGVVTLEDVIEEITGEIHDEYDEEEIPEITHLGNNVYHVLGSTHTEDVSDTIGVEFDPEGDYDTLAGFLIQASGEIPQIGHVLDYGAWRFVVVDADERRVSMIEVRESPVHIPAFDTVTE